MHVLRSGKTGPPAGFPPARREARVLAAGPAPLRSLPRRLPANPRRFPVPGRHPARTPPAKARRPLPTAVPPLAVALVIPGRIRLPAAVRRDPVRTQAQAIPHRAAWLRHQTARPVRKAPAASREPPRRPPVNPRTSPAPVHAGTRRRPPAVFPPRRAPVFHPG